MVPVVVYLSLLLLVLSSTSAAAADSTRNITLPGCPTSCGNISIPYPFGIKPGCFRSGFQLTCTNHKLFLGDHNGTVQVIKIDFVLGQISVNGPIFTIPADANSYSFYWTPLKGGPYIVSRFNNFNAVGCGISTYLIDSETGNVTHTCLLVCGSTDSAVEGMSYCSDQHHFWPSSVLLDLRSYEIRFDRLLGEGEGRASGKAYLTSEDYNFRIDHISSDLGRSVVPLRLDWAIRDQSSCKEAQRNMSTYACRSNDSFCVDQYKGYICVCLSWLEHNQLQVQSDDNPYISGGCRSVYTNGIPNQLSRIK